MMDDVFLFDDNLLALPMMMDEILPFSIEDCSLFNSEVPVFESFPDTPSLSNDDSISSETTRIIQPLVNKRGRPRKDAIQIKVDIIDESIKEEKRKRLVRNRFACQYHKKNRKLCPLTCDKRSMSGVVKGNRRPKDV